MFLLMSLCLLYVLSVMIRKFNECMMIVMNDDDEWIMVVNIKNEFNENNY